MNKCPKCGTEFEGNFCPECGTKWLEERTCPQCGARLGGGVKFCTECGFSFLSQKEKAPTQTANDTQSSPSIPKKAQKIHAILRALPAAMFALFSILYLLFFLAPVAVMPGGDLLGQKIPSESYGNVYQLKNYEDAAFSATLTSLLIFAVIAATLAVVIVLVCLLAGRAKRVSVFGKSIYLQSVLTLLGYALFFALAIISCVLIAQIPKEDGGIDLIKTGAAPILILTFSLGSLVAAIVCSFTRHMLETTYPALKAITFPPRKKRSFVAWMKAHKKLSIAGVLVLVIIIGLSVGIPLAFLNRHNGIYYLYQNGEYNYEKYLILKGNSYTDEEGYSCDVEFDGNNIKIYAEPFGIKDVAAEGTIKDDVLRLKSMDTEIVYAKEGHKHHFENRICDLCGWENNWSEGLDFHTINGSVTVSGLGTCKDINIIIPQQYDGEFVTSIGAGAFRGCSGLTSVTIPNSVTSIGEGAFNGCSGLTEIKVDGNNPTYHAEGNCLIETKSKTLIAGCKTSIIPNDGTVTSIGACAFRDCNELAKITIPDSLTSIGEEAFEFCSGLTSISIPDSVNEIEDFAFRGCSRLTEITIPDSVTKIRDYAFYGCSELTSVTIPNSVASIGRSAFSGCSGLTSIMIPNSVNEIGGFAFRGCSRLTEITIPDSVTFMGNYAFYECYGLTSVTIGSSVTSIGEEAFFGCRGLTSIKFNGTTDEWKAIKKVGNWKNGSSIQEVVCTNGTLKGSDIG